MKDENRESAHPLASFEATHVIFDLAAVRFRPRAAHMLALSPTGELLGTGTSGNGTREACLAALDDAAARTRVWRYGRKVEVGFYNPFTAEISVGPSFAAEVYALPTPVGFPLGGLLLNLSDKSQAVTVSGEAAVLRPSPTLSELSRLFLGSRDSVAPRGRYAHH